MEAPGHAIDDAHQIGVRVRRRVLPALVRLKPRRREPFLPEFVTVTIPKNSFAEVKANSEHPYNTYVSLGSRLTA